MKNLKILSLGFLALILFAIDWWLIDLALYGNKPLIFWFWPIFTSLFAISTLSFFALTNSNPGFFAGVNGAIFLIYILIFPKNIFVGVGGLIFFALLFLFESRVRSEESGRVDFSIRRVLGGTIGVIIYGLIFLLGFNIYNYTSTDFKQNPDQFYQKLGDSAAKSVPYFSKGIERVDSNQTLDDFLISQQEEENPDQSNENYSQQQRFLEEARRQFNQQYGIEAGGSEPLIRVMAQLVTDRIKEAAKPYERFFPLIFTLIIVGLLRTFVFLFKWLVLALSWVFYRFLLSVNFFKIETVSVEVKKLII